MFSRTKLFSASLALGILATAGASGLAQQPQNPSQGQTPGANGQERPLVAEKVAVSVTDRDRAALLVMAYYANST